MNRAQKILMLALNSKKEDEFSQKLKVYAEMSPVQIDNNEISVVTNTINQNERFQDISNQGFRDCYTPVVENVLDNTLPDMLNTANDETSFNVAYNLPSTSQLQNSNNDQEDFDMPENVQYHYFDSDDDIADPNFSMNASNNSDSSITEEIERAGQLLETNLISAGKNRKIRNIKKNAGQSYYNNLGKFTQARKVIELESCRMKCKQKISFELQKDIFKQYWELCNYNIRIAYAAGLIIVTEKKTERKNIKNLRKRTHVNHFFLESHGERIQVCQKCFRFTLCETEQFIKTVVKKKLESPGTIISKDKRGCKTPPNKLNASKENEIRSHIQSFPSYESHYTRKHSEQKYFHADLSLAQMYQLYAEKFSHPVSITTYSKIFKTMNIKFKKPQLDTCNKCETLNMKIKTYSGNELIEIKKELEMHQSDADFAYESKKMDKERTKNNESVKVFTFDLQQCLPTPFLRTNISFYKRQLWTFNLTVHDGKTNQPSCYMWHEADGRRGANEIASCLYEHLKHLPESCREVIFYSDCCAGQNKNSFVSTMFTIVMQSQSNIEIIDHKFLIPGHTHMECDTDHAAIEKKKKRTCADIHHPRDWYQLVRSVRNNNPFIVIEMSRDKFLDFSCVSKDKFMWRKVDENGNKFIWHDVKWLRYQKNFGIIMYKTSLRDEEPFKILNLKRRGIVRVNESDIPLCNTETLKISKEKKKDLLDLLPLIDINYHSFYKNLPTDNIQNYHPDLTELSDDEI